MCFLNFNFHKLNVNSFKEKDVVETVIFLLTGTWLNKIALWSHEGNSMSWTSHCYSPLIMMVPCRQIPLILCVRVLQRYRTERRERWRDSLKEFSPALCVGKRSHDLSSVRWRSGEASGMTLIQFQKPENWGADSIDGSPRAGKDGYPSSNRQKETKKGWIHPPPTFFSPSGLDDAHTYWKEWSVLLSHLHDSFKCYILPQEHPLRHTWKEHFIWGSFCPVELTHKISHHGLSVFPPKSHECRDHIHHVPSSIPST